MYIHTLACFCESRRRFSLFSPLNIYISLFSFSPCSLPAAVFPSSAPQARGHPRPSLLPSCLPSACPPLLLLYVPWLPCVLWWLPSLVSYQAQNGVAVWADAPRIYPRPCLPLPMCCRWLFRGFRPSVRVLSCCLLPAVVWW